MLIEKRRGRATEQLRRGKIEKEGEEKEFILFQAPEEAHTLAQAGLVVDWVKSRRLLVLVRCNR